MGDLRSTEIMDRNRMGVEGGINSNFLQSQQDPFSTTDNKGFGSSIILNSSTPSKLAPAFAQF